MKHREVLLLNIHLFAFYTFWHIIQTFRPKWTIFKCLQRKHSQQLKFTHRYIELFLHAVATANTVPYLYFMSAKIKMARDVNAEDSTNLFILSELAQYIIQDFCAPHGWSLSSYQGNPRLPRDLYSMDKENGHINTTKVYLPLSWLKSRGITQTLKVLWFLEYSHKASQGCAYGRYRFCQEPRITFQGWIRPRRSS